MRLERARCHLGRGVDREKHPVRARIPCQPKSRSACFYGSTTIAAIAIYAIVVLHTVQTLYTRSCQFNPSVTLCLFLSGASSGPSPASPPVPSEVMAVTFIEILFRRRYVLLRLVVLEPPMIHESGDSRSSMLQHAFPMLKSYSGSLSGSRTKRTSPYFTLRSSVSIAVDLF